MRRTAELLRDVVASLKEQRHPVKQGTEATVSLVTILDRMHRRVEGTTEGRDQQE